MIMSCSMACPVFICSKLAHYETKIKGLVDNKKFLSKRIKEVNDEIEAVVDKRQADTLRKVDELYDKALADLNAFIDKRIKELHDEIMVSENKKIELPDVE